VRGVAKGGAQRHVRCRLAETARHGLMMPDRRPGLRIESVRQANLTSILGDLHLGGSASRSELVARTGLTRSSVGALVGELVRAGLAVEERATSDGSPGRPSPVIRADALGNVVLALEVTVDVVAGAVVGLGGTVLARERLDRYGDRRAVADTVGDVVALAQRLERIHGRPIDPLGVGVAAAGLVRRPENVVAIAPNLGWREVPFGDLLAEALPYTAPITLANDADAAALAETRRGVAVGVDDVVLVSGDVGVGGGLVSGGHSLIGRAGFAGEVGHMSVNPDGRRCRCGARGCWETEVGEGSLLRRAGRSPDAGRRGVEAVLADADAGDAAALAALADETRWLAIGLGGLVNVFNPQMVVFGGFFGRLYPYVIDGLRSELSHRALAATAAGLLLVPSALGPDGPLVGAAELAFAPLLADPLGEHRRPSAAAESAGDRADP